MTMKLKLVIMAYMYLYTHSTSNKKKSRLLKGIRLKEKKNIDLENCSDCGAVPEQFETKKK